VKQAKVLFFFFLHFLFSSTEKLSGIKEH